MTDVLNVVKRDSFGTKRNRRLRKAGMIPAVLYGHGKENVTLSVPAPDVNAAIRHGSHFVSLAGDLSDDCLIKDVQWNAFGSQVVHLDLTRVDRTEVVEVTVPVELRGEAPGTHNGGVVEHMLHQVEIRCPAISLPDRLDVSINSLQLGESILSSQLELPEGAEMQIGDDVVVVQCVEPIAEPDEDDEGEAGPAEPELIGGKPGEDDDDDS